MKWTAIPLLLALAAPLAAEGPKFKLTDGDRVVFLGSTVVERDQTFGHFETMLTAAFKDVDFTFRNLGWSGDNVWGESRAGFGTVKEGYTALLKQVNECKPTVLLVDYGTNESFDGEAGLPKFVKGYETLLDDLAKTGAKIWLISPTLLQNFGRSYRDPAGQNIQITAYTQAIRTIAEKRGCGFIDLLDLVKPDSGHDAAMTDDQMHFNTYGAGRFASRLGSRLGLKDPLGGLDGEQFEKLRQATIEKNREYFYRWRPQNETYIFGFRKKEQGRNAVEIPQFDPIVEKLEAEINRLKKGK